MELARLHSRCGLCTTCRVPCEEEGVVVLGMTVIAVAVCNQMAQTGASEGIALVL